MSQTEGFAGVRGLLCVNRASPGQTMMGWATLLTWRPQTLQLPWASQTCALGLLARVAPLLGSAQKAWGGGGDSQHKLPGHSVTQAGSPEEAVCSRHDLGHHMGAVL